MLLQYFKHLAVHTRFEPLIRRARALWTLADRARAPELGAIYDEPYFIEAACRRLLTPESNTIDIGAHLGSQLSVFVDLARYGQHMAFEPVPQKARWLRAKFPNVDVREVALHNVAGQNKFFVNVSRPGYSGLRAHVASNDVLQNITVEQRTLDDLIEPQREIDLIKIDVEGAELFVLQGATQLLARCRPTLLFESTRSAMQVWDVTPDEIFSFLAGLDYRVFLPRSFVSGGLPLRREEFAEAHEYPFLAFNFIASAPERALGRRRFRSLSLQSERVPIAGKSRVA